MPQHYSQLPNPHSSYKSGKLHFLLTQNQFQRVNVWPRDPNSFRAKQGCLTPQLPLIACKRAQTASTSPNPPLNRAYSIQTLQTKFLRKENVVPYPIPKKGTCKMNIFILLVKQRSIPLPAVLISCLAAQPASQLRPSACRSHISCAQVGGISENTLKPSLQ